MQHSSFLVNTGLHHIIRIHVGGDSQVAFSFLRGALGLDGFREPVECVEVVAFQDDLPSVPVGGFGDGGLDGAQDLHG